jgi:hypothetical protein
MHLIPSKSVYGSLKTKNGTVFVTSKEYDGFPHGVNKPREYSWFYCLAIEGEEGELVKVNANSSDSTVKLTRNNSLVFYSTDKFKWKQLKVPVYTDHEGLVQRYEFELPTNKPIYLSNTILFEYEQLRQHIDSLLSDHRDVITSVNIGQSLDNHPLEIFSFNKSKQPRGRILVTTGCHPAEPDVIGSLAIIKYLLSPDASELLENFIVDVMPMQNPDGYVNSSCLTSNGINLYWNFLKDDFKNSPEASNLWKYIKENPPLLYLDFHSYVHQYHRHPMPYLKDPDAYVGFKTKSVVKKMDRLLIKQSSGFYRFGKLAMWPESLSSFITQEFNAIAYTKYHFNLYEGIAASQDRAVNIFTGLTKVLLDNKVTQDEILRQPYGKAVVDQSDKFPITAVYEVTKFYRRVYMYLRSYLRYYLHRNKTKLF